MHANFRRSAFRHVYKCELYVKITHYHNVFVKDFSQNSIKKQSICDPETLGKVDYSAKTRQKAGVEQYKQKDVGADTGDDF